MTVILFPEARITTMNAFCPKCGSPIAENAAEGLCGRCLMLAAMDSQNQSPAFVETVPSKSGFVPPEIHELAGLFPHLEPQNLIGHGGMGAVYQARQIKLDRMVALKIVRPDTTDDAAFTERFNREAKTLARLNHPNIVSIYDYGEVRFQDGSPLFYFVMEFVDGVNLRHMIQTQETKPEEALAVIPQICAALQYAHQNGVVHRDIKPENILLDQEGQVKIADFGLAKLGGDQNFQLTGTHQVLGTLRYMAPEQMQHSNLVDHRADIYSLGVVLYELLTGELPAGVFEPPSARKSVDARLDQVVMKALASDPDKRYQSVSEVGNDVSSISGVHQPNTVSLQENYVPGPSTIIDNGVAAAVAGVKGMFGGTASDDHVADLGRSDAHLPRDIDQNPQWFPEVCAVCGCETKRRGSNEFNFTPPWATGLIVMFMILFFPIGIAIAVLTTEKVRLSLPICRNHRHHWTTFAWWAGLGWMLILVGVFGGIWLADVGGSYKPYKAWVLIGCILAGVALYVIPLIMMGTTRIGLTKMDKKTIQLKNVSPAFTEAMRRHTSASQH